VLKRAREVREEQIESEQMKPYPIILENVEAARRVERKSGDFMTKFTAQFMQGIMATG
jgi:hypothetical protein